MSALLETRELSKRFVKHLDFAAKLAQKLGANVREEVIQAVDQVDLNVSQGEVVGLVGESGCGKTITGLSLLRLVPKPAGRIVGGKVLFDGEDLLQKSDAEMRRIRGAGIATILQDPMTSLNPTFTIGSQVGEAISLHQGLREQRLWERIMDMLRLVRVPSPEARVRAFPHELSGGMRQRVVGAIALSCAPRLLIADEPTTSLDLTIQAQYLDLLKEIQQRQKMALIFITHDFGVVAKMCDRVCVMYAGRIVESAPVQELFDRPIHPYTNALLQSLPRLGEKRRTLFSIEGQPPSLVDLPPGCSFAPRCPDKVPACERETPPLLWIGEQHFVCCWASTKGS